MKVLKHGQCVRHADYGVGVATRSDASRTTIDFYEHGPKTFVTDIFSVELLDETPPRPRKPRAKAAASRKAGAAADKGD